MGNVTVKLELSKIAAVESFPTPNCKMKKEIRAFLGLTGYYQRFISDFSTNSAPLSDSTRKAAANSIKWTSTCEESFQSLKSALCTHPLLYSPDLSKQFILQTDASDRAVGVVLSQVSEDGEHPVAFFRKKLLPQEECYSTVEKECLAIKLATAVFKVYLLGRLFTIQTDHRSLEWLDRLKENNPRLCRRSLALQPFDFTVEHRSGVKNSNADALWQLLSCWTGEAGCQEPSRTLYINIYIM